MEMESTTGDRLSAADERATMRRVFRRIVPLCFVLYIISYIDRANIGYAALQMNAELGLTADAFGFAAGIFFIGYFLFEVPSNMLMARYGARVWIARILIGMGMVSMLTAFVQTSWQLYLVRFLLGIAEAGYFPAIIIYLTSWFRAREQATVVALFTSAIPVSYIVGTPISTFIMDHVSGFGLTGWRWMFLIEGVPAVIGGLLTYRLLVDRPANARWLRQEERDWLEGEIAIEHAARDGVKHLGTWGAITDRKVLFLSLVYFVYQAGSLGVGYWLPQIVKSAASTMSNVEIGLVATIPYVIATIGMIWWSRRSDRTGERQRHAAWPLLAAAIGLAAVVPVGGIVASAALLSLALTGFYAFKAPFWTLPGIFLSRSTAAVSIAAINSIGNLGGFVGPYAVGLVAKESGKPALGLLFLAALTLVAFAMVWLARLAPRAEYGQ
ncbi:MFS transporter [Sphingomonas sp. dw_22]|uniref:MFS transporter n=1 Tax=Sphingomonas sp. dw_22 TaxID=2721175 RepID=UPI001BD1CD8B|nr:MFS transporter [Sphingomonas sp. dw_22]